MKTKNFLIPLSIIFLFISCEKEKTSITKFTEVENIKYHFNISEGYPDYQTISIPVIYFNMNTEQIFGCCNFMIQTSMSMESNTITIEISGISLDGNVCLTALGPATARFPLDLTNDEYTLYIKENNSVDKFKVLVSQSKIEIVSLRSLFNNPLYTTYWRYPEKSFACLCGTTTETSWICSHFLDTLQQTIDLVEFSFEEGGEICYPESSMGHYYDMPARYFYYQDEQDFDTAGDLLRAYVERHVEPNSGIGISLINWKNKKFLSWMMDQK